MGGFHETKKRIIKSELHYECHPNVVFFSLSADYLSLHFQNLASGRDGEGILCHFSGIVFCHAGAAGDSDLWYPCLCQSEG